MTNPAKRKTCPVFQSATTPANAIISGFPFPRALTYTGGDNVGHVHQDNLHSAIERVLLTRGLLDDSARTASGQTRSR